QKATRERDVHCFPHNPSFFARTWMLLFANSQAIPGRYEHNVLFADDPVLTCRIKCVGTFIDRRLDFSARILAAVINRCQGFCVATSLFAVRCPAKIALGWSGDKAAASISWPTHNKCELTLQVLPHSGTFVYKGADSASLF